MARLLLISCVVGMAVAPTPVAGRGRLQADGPYLGQTPPGTTPRLFAPGVVSREGAQSKLLVAPDGREILFCERDPATGRFRLVSVTRTDDAWSAPTPLPFSTEYATNEPTLSPDGRRLFFVSDRPASGGGPPEQNPDIWVVEKRAGGWGEPRNLGAPVNTADVEVQPFYGSNDELYFCRQAGNVRSLLVSRYAGGRFSNPVEVDLRLHGRRVSGPAVSPDNRTLLVHSNMEGGQGSWDLYASFRNASGYWGDLVNLGPEVNTGGAEADATFSPDGRYLFFSRDGDIHWVSASLLDRVRTEPVLEAAGRVAALARIDAWLQQEATAGRFSGAVLVADRGRAVYERAFGFADREARVPNTVTTPFNICSMGKMFTAATALLGADAQGRSGRGAATPLP